MLWRPQRLIAELDGRQHELQFEADREKDADLLAHGYRVVRVTYERLTEQTAKEAARFRPAAERRGRDSNPRCRGYPHNGFRDRPIQPLSHPSGVTPAG